MSTFALDSNSSDGDKISALNYVLSNLGQGGTSANTANVLTANVTTGVISTQGTTVAYLYQYMNVAYANTATGGSFSSNSANKLYYGIHNNTANVADTNPADYQWTQVSGGGFGTTKSLYYQTLGGRQIYFNIGTTSPGYYFRSVQDNVAINLDDVTSTQAIYSATVYRRGNTTPATPTGGTYNFGNLFLTPPTGWYANTPPADGNTYIFTSQNTFQSSQNNVNPPNGAWTFPTLFQANGANGTSTYNYTVYTAANTVPSTPATNTGSWNFSTGVGVPPVDPQSLYPPASNVVIGTGAASTRVDSIGDYIYYTFTATSTADQFKNFTITGNAAIVDVLLVGGGGYGGDGSNTSSAATGGTGGQVKLVSNISLGTGTTYQVNLRGYALNQGGSASITSASGVPTALGGITGNTMAYPATGIGGGGDGGANAPSGINGANGVAIPWTDVTWVGQTSGGNVWFGGGGGGKTGYIGGGSPTYGAGGTGGGGVASSVGGNALANSGGGGGARSTNTGGNQGIGSNPVVIVRQHKSQAGLTWPTWSNVQPVTTSNTVVYSSTALAYTNTPTVPVTTLVWQTPVQFSGNTGSTGNTGPRGFVPMAYVATAGDPTSYTTGQYTYAFSANRANVALPIGTGYSPTQGDVAQFVYTPTNTVVVKEYNQTANVWQAVNGQVISGNVFVTGSVNATALNANDVYTLTLRGGLGVPGNFSSPGFWMEASSGNARMAGTTSIGDSLTVGNNARIGNSLNIGNNLTVGNNAVIGNNLGVGNFLVVGDSAYIGNNLTVNSFANIGGFATIGDSLSVGTNAIIGNNLQVGNNAIVGNNFGVGNTAVIGNNLTVGSNAIIGANLTVGTNAQIGNNLIVGTNAVVGDSFGVGNNAVIGNNLTVGNNAIIGSSVAIGNNLNIGNNAVIGGNLTVSGLVTAGSLQANTVATTTMVPNSATATSGRQSVGYTVTSPTQVYAGYDGTYYIYQTANVVTNTVSITCTTNSVTNVISGYIDLFGSTTINGAATIIPQMYAQLYRIVGANITAVGGSFVTTPAYNGYVGAATSWQTAQSKLPYRLNEVSLIDTFTVTAPQVVSYVWLFGSYVNVTSNVAPTQDYIGIDATGGYGLTVTNYKR